MYRVIEHRARKYLDPATGRIHLAPIPDEVRKGGLLGAGFTAATAFMKGGCHMSYTTIQKFLKELMKLDIVILLSYCFLKNSSSFQLGSLRQDSLSAARVNIIRCNQRSAGLNPNSWLN